ncbi:MAG TPA: ankyrin repeat domain-containing protein [Gemmataceae bacterium]|jgi:ankyrin repeat protein|nr:ankyrin repeat domain-containing protein [Gemmataceae bacterium]
MNEGTDKHKILIDQIRDAFRRDDAGSVRQLIALHPELKARINDPLGPFDSPPIVNVRSQAMLDLLLEAGADINAKSQWWAGGFGLLHGANPDVAAYAIERGAIVDVHAAARLGLLPRLQELISGDPSLVHARGGDGQTPLHFASTIPIAAYLLDHGARIDERDIDHESTPAQWMVGDRQEICRFLVERGCSTDILLASALGNLALVGKHLDADPACIRMRVSQEFFPMINKQAGGTIYQWTLGFYLSAHLVARKFGHEPVLELLFQRSPPALKLIESCWLKDDAAVRSLRINHPDYAADLTEADRRQVAHAARNNEAVVVRLLLESGLPVDCKGQHQATPLHWAAFHGNTEMTKTILSYGPSLEATDADFQGTPLGWAIHGSENGWNCRAGDYAGTVEALIQAGAEVPTEIRGSQAVREVLARHKGV